MLTLASSSLKSHYESRCCGRVGGADGYDYTCSPGDIAVADGLCHVTAAKQTSLVAAKKQLATAAPPGRIWQANSSTPHFFYLDVNQKLHRVDYDDSQSLVAKYLYAKSVGARGTGMVGT